MATADIFGHNGLTAMNTIKMNPFWSRNVTIMIEKQDGTAGAVVKLKDPPPKKKKKKNAPLNSTIISLCFAQHGWVWGFILS